MTDAADVRAALHELVAEYFARVDRWVDLPVAELFVSEGRMRLGPLNPNGREAIATYFSQRRADEDAGGRKTRHVMSNMVVETADAERARVRLQCLVFAGVGDFPLPSAAPATIADFAVDCVFVDGGWMIDELRGQTTFSGANAARFAR